MMVLINFSESFLWELIITSAYVALNVSYMTELMSGVKHCQVDIFGENIDQIPSIWHLLKKKKKKKKKILKNFIFFK